MGQDGVHEQPKETKRHDVGHSIRHLLLVCLGRGVGQVDIVGID